MDVSDVSLLSAAISQAWQVTLLVVLVAVVVRLFARHRPHLAYVLWLLVLLKCVTPPLVSSPTGLFCWVESLTSQSSANESEPEYHFTSQHDAPSTVRIPPLDAQDAIREQAGIPAAPVSATSAPRTHR